MSRSKRDQRGKRINNEIWGRECFKVVEDRVYPACGGEPVGSPGNKRNAKRRVARIRRKEYVNVIRAGLQGE